MILDVILPKSHYYVTMRVPLSLQNPVSHSRTKHKDICHHFLRDHKTKGDIEICHVSTEMQLADIFTKPLDESRFCALRSELNILDSCNVV